MVCTAPIFRDYSPTWGESRVRAKLANVLWVPVISESRDIGSRRFGTPRLWSPSPAEEAILREDWEGLSEMMELGDFDLLDSHLGEALQIRPKAANAAALTWTVDGNGDWSGVVPRGFYLRARFTARSVAADGAFLP